VDSAGNLFLTDSWNHRIRKVTPDGIISTVAGNGNASYGGDGGPATSASIFWPFGIAVDTAGTLFIADTCNNRIRKVTLDGIISTVAGNGGQGYSGDGGTATSAQIYYPWGIAVDSAGTLFFTDSMNLRIRKVTSDGAISTVAGNGSQGFHGDGGPATSAQLYTPAGMAVDAEGNLFVAEYGGSRIRWITPAGVISTLAGKVFIGFSGDGGPAASAQLNGPTGVALDAVGNLFIADANNNRIREVVKLRASTNFTIGAGGSANSSTAGINGTAQAGYATVAINSGSAPYSTAVFSFKQNGVTVTEAGVPASPPTTTARIFIDYRSSVPAIPSRAGAGRIDINTGIAAVNSGSASAHVTYTLRDIAGNTISIGHGTLAAGAHFAKFIDQLKSVAPDFVLPANFRAALQFASLEISSDQPVSIIALRMTINQRSEALFTTTPIVDLTKPASAAAIFFPHFADGGGYTTSIVLLNTSNSIETGTLQILDDNGDPFIVTQAGGASGSNFVYSIPIGGAVRFQTDGFSKDARSGWVRLTPDMGTLTPAGAAVFSFNPEEVLVTESGVPATTPTTHARIYVDLSGGHNTGLAIANPAGTEASITITAFRKDGITGVGTSQRPLRLSANGYGANFADELIAGLPAEFAGVLDIASPSPFAAVTIRSLINERDDFLMATFPIADMTEPAPSPIVFPHIADGDGYATQFIVIGSAGGSSATLNFRGENGTPLAVGK
jgi:hypothetical protein